LAICDKTIINISKNFNLIFSSPIKTRPAWAGFKTAEEGRAKICKFLWQKLKNKSNIEKLLMNNFITLLEQFYNSFRTIL
jgi:hypothetical protein